jgi:endonuclease/exonuclease/phosphatase family metal-dependent hydrolase
MPVTLGHVRLASFNVENLFERAKAMNLATWAEGRPVLAAYERFNRLAQLEVYTDAVKAEMAADLRTLRILARRNTPAGTKLKIERGPRPRWARLRENRGQFVRQPRDGDAVIVAAGREDWIGWVELTTETVTEIAIHMTAQVVRDSGADVLAVVEAENRPALVRFNEALLDERYAHVMLVEGNDPRGIDVGIMTGEGYDILSIRSHVDDPDPERPGARLFSRDCPVYELRTPRGATVHVLVNHLKSQSWTSGDPDPLRRRQAARVREIYEELVAAGAEYVAVVGDLNKAAPPAYPSLEPLLGPDSPLVDSATLPVYRRGSRPGTFQSCGERNRLDYILLSPPLAERVTGGGVVRTGLWGGARNKNPPRFWDIYPEIRRVEHSASDHALIYVDLDV